MQITAEKREKLGKKTKQLRYNNKIPAVVFGKGMESTPISIDYTDFIRVFKKSGETSLIDLKWDKNNEKVLVTEVQYHPVTDKVIHVNFNKVDLTSTINADIPVELIGEENSPVIKSGEGMPLVLLNTITVEALPTDLPSSFEVDVSSLTEIDQAITIAELSYDKEKVTIVSNENDDLVVKITHAEMEEVAEEEEVSEEDLIAGMEATQETAEENDESPAESTEKHSEE